MQEDAISQQTPEGCSKGRFSEVGNIFLKGGSNPKRKFFEICGPGSSNTCWTISNMHVGWVNTEREARHEMKLKQVFDSTGQANLVCPDMEVSHHMRLFRKPKP